MSMDLIPFGIVQLEAVREVMADDSDSFVTLSGEIDRTEALAATDKAPPLWHVSGRASTTATNLKGFKIRPSAWPKAIARLNGRMPRIFAMGHPQFEEKLPVGRITALIPDENGLRYEGIVRNPVIGAALESEDLDSASVGIRIFKMVLGDEGEPPEVDDLFLIEMTLTAIPADPGAQLDKVRRLTAHLESGSTVVAPTPEPTGENNMNRELLCVLLNLPTDSTDAAITNAIRRLQTQGDTLAAVASELELSSSTTEAILNAFADARSAEGFVTLDAHKAVVTELSTLRREQLLAPVRERIPEPLLPLAERLATEGDVEQLNALVASLPRAPQGRIIEQPEGERRTGGDRGDNVTAHLTDDDRLLMEQLGVDWENAEEMDRYANLPPNEALSLLWPELRFPQSLEDHQAMSARSAREDF